MPDTTKTSPDKTQDTQPDDEQTWIAHVENGTVKARVKSEEWVRYARKNNL